MNFSRKYIVKMQMQENLKFVFQNGFRPVVNRNIFIRLYTHCLFCIHSNFGVHYSLLLIHISFFRFILLKIYTCLKTLETVRKLIRGNGCKSHFEIILFRIMFQFLITTIFKNNLVLVVFALHFCHY